MSISADTIFAHSSGRPPAAIAVIRITGPDAHRVAEGLCGSLPVPRQAGLRTLRSAGGEILDDALVLRFDGPASVTGEHLVELHCHGSRAVVAAILRELATSPGLREALPGEFTRRSFENGRIDLTQAEGLADLLEAETEGQRRAALQVTGGAIRRQVELWRDELLVLSAKAEAAIDYADEEDETQTQAADLAQAASQLRSDIASWLARPRAEPLRHGVRVVIAGPPNAGKSSLLNSLVGIDRAIVSQEPGTTRDVIEVPVSFAGIPFLLIDTAGLRTGGGAIESVGIQRAEQQIAAADVVLWMGRPEVAPDHPRIIRLHGQVDRLDRHDIPPGSLAVSSITGAGLESLVEQLTILGRTLLPEADVVALNDRQAKALREVADAVSSASPKELELTAEAFRQARSAIDRVTGSAGVEDLLDSLFRRFCLGK